MFIYMQACTILGGFKILNFNIFLFFLGGGWGQKNVYFGGIMKLWIFWGPKQNWTLMSFIYI